MKIGDDLFVSKGSQSAEAAGKGASIKESAGGADFQQMLDKGIKAVNSAMLKADELSAKSAAGEPVGVAETMVAVAEADISFRFLLQVRNRALSAYEEIMRLQF